MRMTMRGRSAAVTAAMLVLGFCLLGLASASAQTVFAVSGTIADGSSFSGTLTIDTTVASDSAISAANITIGPPDSDTCTSISFQIRGGPPGYEITIACTSGNDLFLTLLSDAAGDLLGYTGGPINTSFSDYVETPVTGGSVAPVVPPTISKAFAQSALQLFGANTTALSFTIANPGANLISLSGIAFSDTLPAGLVVATPNGLIGTCGGGTITATAGTNIISLSGATLAAGASCTFSVNVSATAIGVMVNTTSNVTAMAGTIVGGTATATTSVSALLWLWFFSESGGGGRNP